MVIETSTVQDYLKAIHQLGGSDQPVSTSELAERLDVTPASVSAMLRRLHDEGLVEHRRYQGVRLTPAGARQAVEMIRHHRLLELYLAEVVGMPWDKVHDEAEVLEHVLSEDLESRLAEILGDPKTDPHGHPIPGPDLEFVPDEHPTLGQLDAGDRARVAWVDDRDPDLLRYLEGLGLLPGMELEVLEVVPYGGGTRVRIGRSEAHVGTQAVPAVFVTEVRVG